MPSSSASKTSSAVITKRDLTLQISAQTGLTQDQVHTIIGLFVDAVTESLAGRGEVALRNFGTFEVRVAKAKIGRNPRAPEKELVIPERAVVKFKPGRILKEQVAGLMRPGSAALAKV